MNAISSTSYKVRTDLDEKPKQLLGEKRMAIPMKPGSPEKYDYEYVRNGTANLFVAVEFKAGKRVTQVTKRRTMKDFALFVKMLIDGKYSDAEVIRLVTGRLAKIAAPFIWTIEALSIYPAYSTYFNYIFINTRSYL